MKADVEKALLVCDAPVGAQVADEVQRASCHSIPGVTGRTAAWRGGRQQSGERLSLQSSGIHQCDLELPETSASSSVKWGCCQLLPHWVDVDAQ